MSDGSSGIWASDLKQPTDTEPRLSIKMDFKPVYASGDPDGWRVMDDHGFRFVARDGQWHPQVWPAGVIRHFEGER